MIEKGYKGGLVSRVRNKHSHKKYVISTAQEVGQDYWTTVVFPGILFGFLPNLSKKMFTVVRNNKEDAHNVHWKVKKIILNLQENEWFEEMPNPQPQEGWSSDAKKKLEKHKTDIENYYDNLNTEKNIEKGIYFVAGKDGVPVLWKNDKAFTEKEIQHYIKTGKSEKKALSMLLPIFSEAWMALQYSKRHSLQDAQAMQITNQKYWSYILKIIKDNNVQRVVVNPCIHTFEHECALLTYKLDKVADFPNFNSSMKNFESFDGKCGYDSKKLFDTK